MGPVLTLISCPPATPTTPSIWRTPTNVGHSYADSMDRLGRRSLPRRDNLGCGQMGGKNSFLLTRLMGTWVIFRTVPMCLFLSTSFRLFLSKNFKSNFCFRYYLQAVAQMESDNWILMKQEGQTQPEWLKESLEPGAVVGFDPYLFTATGMVENTILRFCLNIQRQ